MKFSFSFLLFLILLTSCASDEDICISGEATPRMKIKFKEGGKELQLQQLILAVDYGDGVKKTVFSGQRVDSVLVPLRVDDALFTDLYVKTSEEGQESKVRIEYRSESSYVSPACGIKKLYKEVSSSLLQPSPVVSVEQIQTEINDELPSHIYFVF